MKRFLWAFLALAAAAGIYVAVISVNSNVVTAVGATVARRTLEHTIATTGSITSEEAANAVSLAGGVVAEVTVGAGDTVNRGDVLVRLSDSGANELLTAAQELEARSQAVSAQYGSSDISQLIAAAQLSSLELGSLEALLDFANAPVAVSAPAACDFSELEAAVDASVIRAGVSGTVTSVLVSPGSAVAAGQPVARICDLSRLRVVCRVGESDSARVEPGDYARLVSRATGTIYTGTVSDVSVAASVTADAAISGPTVDVTITPSTEFTGRVGMSTDVVIPYSRVEHALCIPVSALTSDGCVYLLSEDGRAVLTRVTTGMTTDRYVEITSGLDSGDVVLIGSELSDGAKVELT